MSYSSASSTSACSPITSYSDPFAGRFGADIDGSSDSGFGEMCKCGGALKLQKVRDGPDVGKLLYRCSWREDGGEHTEKQWDKAVGDELLSHWATLLEHDSKLKKLSCRLRDLTNTVDPENLSTDLLILQEQMSTVLCQLASNSVPRKSIFQTKSDFIGDLTTRMTGFKVPGMYAWMWTCFAVSMAANIYFVWT